MGQRVKSHFEKKGEKVTFKDGLDRHLGQHTWNKQNVYIERKKIPMIKRRI